MTSEIVDTHTTAFINRCMRAPALVWSWLRCGGDVRTGVRLALRRLGGRESDPRMRSVAERLGRGRAAAAQDDVRLLGGNRDRVALVVDDGDVALREVHEIRSVETDLDGHGHLLRSGRWPRPARSARVASRA